MPAHISPSIYLLINKYICAPFLVAFTIYSIIFLSFSKNRIRFMCSATFLQFYFLSHKYIFYLHFSLLASFVFLFPNFLISLFLPSHVSSRTLTTCTITCRTGCNVSHFPAF